LPADAPAPASALRLILSLGVAGAVAGLLIVGVFDATSGTIAAHKAEVLRRAVAEVLQDPARHETRWVVEGRVVRERPSGGSAENALPIHVGLDADGRVTGVAVEAAEAGFQDVITLLYGFDPTTGRLLGMKVLESRETPGLGDRIEKDAAFVSQFAGARMPLTVVKRPTGAEGEIDAISGATISSRAVVRMIDRSFARVEPAVEGTLVGAVQ
jgi:electron transport complex protein RnfG